MVLLHKEEVKVCSMDGGDGFQVVSRKKAGKPSKYLKTKLSLISNDSCCSSLNNEEIKHDLEKHMKDLKGSPFCETFEDTLYAAGLLQRKSDKDNDVTEVTEVTTDGDNQQNTAILHSTCTPQDIVCYGIGHFSVDVTAKYQMSLLVTLRHMIKITDGQCYVFDPVLSHQDRHILTDLGCQIIPQNEEAKRRVDRPTLFYMPHCDKALYNNLLWSNWCPDTLSNVMILGNSFSYMHLHTPGRILQQEGAYIIKSLPHVKEYPVDNSFCHKDIFNDMALHVIDKNSLANADSNFWTDCTEPVYKDIDTGIIYKD